MTALVKHKKFSKNRIDIARMSRDDRGQLMANLSIDELENTGKIGNYLVLFAYSDLKIECIFGRVISPRFIPGQVIFKQI